MRPCPGPAVAAMALAACTTQYDPCFPPSSLVSSLRVLGVRIDPPEVLFDPATFAAPPVSVTVLVAHPDESYGPILFRARACAPPPDGRSCPGSTQWTLTVRGEQGSLPEVRLFVPPAIIRTARDEDPLRGYGGIRVRVEVEVTGPAASAAATKLLIFSEDRPGAAPNQGLEISGFELVPRNGPRFSPAPGTAIQIGVGDWVGLSPLLAPVQGATDAAEEYEVVDLAGRRVQLRERISYAFFVTPHAQYGRIGRPEVGADVADEPGPGEPRPPDGLARLSALNEAPARAFVVARDGRGGEAWAVLPFTMVDERPCGRNVGGAARCPVLEIGCQ